VAAQSCPEGDFGEATALADRDRLKRVGVAGSMRLTCREAAT
jgi:hypothetical protein